MKCPIRSACGNERVCYGEGCALWDEQTLGCLIRAFLITQIEKADIIIKPVSSPSAVAELAPLEKRVEKLEKDVVYASMGFPIDSFLGGKK